VFDSGDFIYVSSRYLNLIQKLTPEGRVLKEWGGTGSGPGEFTMPWGMDVDSQGDLYVADWRNDRVQKFDSEGIFLKTYGESGRGVGQFHRPSSVAVDTNLNVAVADWGNERVQILDNEGPVTNVLEGEATLSKWSHEWLDVNLDEREARNRADLKVLDLPDHLKNAYHEASQTEHKFWGPVSVKFDSENQLYVTEHSMQAPHSSMHEDLHGHEKLRHQVYVKIPWNQVDSPLSLHRLFPYKNPVHQELYQNQLDSSDELPIQCQCLP
jgi:hypothetical protein